MAAEADLKRITVINRDPEAFNALTRKDIGERKIRLIVLSPLLSYLDCNFRDEIPVRQALEKMSSLVRGTRCTIVAILHPNKKVDLAAIERLLGTVAFANFVRTLILLRDEGGGCARLVHAKHNLSIKGDDLLFVKINKQEPNRPRQQYVGIEWEKADTNIDPDEAFKKAKADTSAVDWLLEYLRDGEWRDLKDIYAQGEKYGHTQDAIRQAKLRNRDIDHEIKGTRSSRVTRWRMKKRHGGDIP
jgi:hypothetical protein